MAAAWHRIDAGKGRVEEQSHPAVGAAVSSLIGCFLGTYVRNPREKNGRLRTADPVSSIYSNKLKTHTIKAATLLHVAQQQGSLLGRKYEILQLASSRVNRLSAGCLLA